MKGVVLAARSVSKVFPGGIRALDCVTLELRSGEVHAVVGENGAGKSTLAKILAGYLLPDEGFVEYRGVRVSWRGPWEALEKGVVYVPQYPRLVEQLTVAENAALALNCSPAEAARTVEEAASKLGISVNPHTPVYKLPVDARQRAALAIAFALKPLVLLLDEPTTVLSPVEVPVFLNAVRRAAEAGVAVMFVSHRLDEVARIADRVTVLRSGRIVAELLPPIRIDEVARLMIGSEATPRLPSGARARRLGEPLLVVEDLWVEGDYGNVAVRGISFEVRRGEVLGIVGVEGNGERELFEAVVGLRRPLRGKVLLSGKLVSGIRSFRMSGGSYIPGDRLEGLVLELSVAENSVLNAAISRLLGFILSRGELVAKLRDAASVFGVKYSSPWEPVAALSGGNQQRLLLGRELLSARNVVVAYAPSTGLDFASTARLLTKLREYADSGGAVLLYSPDVREVLSIADRIAVMRRGRFVAVFKAGEVSVEEIGRLMVAGGEATEATSEAGAVTA